jgi:hypothetical protein
MRKSMLLVSGLGALVMFFQNCAPPMKPARDAISGGEVQELPADSADFRKLDTDSFDTITLMNEEESIDVNLQDGRADAFVGSQRRGSYCFTAEDLSQVRAIIASAQVCEPMQPYAQVEGSMCTMIYGYAYAGLKKGSQRLMLGEKFNGCHIPTDLCGGSGQNLKAAVTMLKNLLNERRCQ